MYVVNGGEMEELDLRDIYYMIRKRFWLVIVLAALSAITAGLVSYFVLVPNYSTSTKLILGEITDYENLEGITSNDIEMNRKLIGTYKEVAKSATVLDEVVNRLSYSTTTGSILGSLSISLLNDTEIIKISVKGESPKEITELANTLSEVFMETVTSLMKIENVQVLDKAVVPTDPISPNKKRNIAIAGVLGVMVAVFIIFILEMFDNTIKIPEEVNNRLELPVLGIIPVHE